MLLLAGLALLGFPLVLLPFMVLLSFSRPSGLGFLDSYKIELFELFADGRVLDANKFRFLAHHRGSTCWHLKSGHQQRTQTTLSYKNLKTLSQMAGKNSKAP